ncbi:MAG: DUF6541 family protein [Brachybacterium alimentarium]
MSSVLPVLCGAVLLGAPGYLMLCALDVRLRLRWGWAPAVTVLLTVVLGALFRVLGIRWTLLSAVIGIVLLVALAAVVRLALQRRTARRLTTSTSTSTSVGVPAPQDWSRGTAAAVTGASILSGALVAASAARRMGGISTLNGSFDSFFHLSAAAFIRERGDASFTTALSDIYGEPTFYPVVFDDLVAILPFDVITAANAMMLAMLAAIPPAVAAMVVGVSRPARSAPLLVALSAGAATLFLSTPAMALVMGLWPIVLGVVCLPPAIAAVLMLTDRRHGAPGVGTAAGLVLIVIGTALAHPSVLFSVAVVAGLRLLAGGIERMLGGGRLRGLIEVCAALAAAVLFVAGSHVLLSGMALTKPSLDGVGSVLGEILLDSPRIPAVPALLWPMAALWILAMIGAAAAVRSREVLGATAALGLLASLMLGVATQIDHPLAVALVNPWYGARERIAPLMMCMLVLLMARGLLALLESGGRRRRSLPGALAVGAVVVTVLIALVTPQRLPLMGSLAYTAYGVQLTPYVTSEERSFIERTAQELPEGSVVLADPLDGATLYWSVGGVETVFPTMSRPLTREKTLIAHYAHRAGTDEASVELCRALEPVGPTHLYRDTSEASGQRINPEDSERWRGVHDIPESRLTLVDASGPYALYELDPAC